MLQEKAPESPSLQGSHESDWSKPTGCLFSRGRDTIRPSSSRAYLFVSVCYSPQFSHLLSPRTAIRDGSWNMRDQRPVSWEYLASGNFLARRPDRARTHPTILSPARLICLDKQVGISRQVSSSDHLPSIINQLLDKSCLSGSIRTDITYKFHQQKAAGR